MKPKANGMSRSQNSRSLPGEGPNWILIAGGALLSTLSIRLGYKLKQLQDTKQMNSNRNELKENGKGTGTNKSGCCHFHSRAYPCVQEEAACFSSIPDSNGMLGVKQQCTDTRLAEGKMVLPLVRIPAPEFGKENGVVWSSSPQLLELPQKPFNKSNGSDSPSISEAGSDLFTNREVIQKLRQQLKRRDEMIMEMQDQISELQNALNSQLSHSTHLQTLLDTANRDLFDSEREIQRLRKAIADYCVAQDGSAEKQPMIPVWPGEGRNSHGNGYLEVENNLEPSEKARDAERVEMLKTEVNELKEVIEGKEYLLQSYKEQKLELSTKIKELQQRLDSQLPNYL